MLHSKRLHVSVSNLFRNFRKLLKGFKSSIHHNNGFIHFSPKKFKNIQMNRILNHYVSFACATHPTPANNNDFFSFNDWEQLESDSDYNLSANDALENATVFSDTNHDQSQDEFSFSLSQDQGALHLCVTAQEVLEIGNNLTIDSSDIAMFSFQDKGWVELEQDSKSSGELHYRTYLHDTGAIVKISSRIQIIHADTAGHLN